jgi:predicted nucleic acid-binding protein
VKTFVSSLPSWLEIRAVTTPIDASLSHLDRGEQEAITLALEIQAEALLIDETKGRDALYQHFIDLYEQSHTG